MRNPVVVKTYASLPDCDRNEILRYAGARESNADLQALLEACLLQCDGIFTPRVCHTVLTLEEFNAIFPHSEDVQKRLQGYPRVVVFAASVGLAIDRLVNRYATVSPSKALLLQAIGAERIECLCDVFCKEWKNLGETGGRFSPGYGDFPLTAQREFFTLLAPSKHVGVTLTESLLMSPTKSVTAAFGIRA